MLAPANGKFENGTCGNVYGSSCRFAYNEGYKITGSVERKCVKKSDTDEAYWKLFAVLAPLLQLTRQSLVTIVMISGPVTTQTVSSVAIVDLKLRKDRKE